MSIVLKTVGVIVKNMAATLDFYRLLGMTIPDSAEEEDNVEVATPEGITLGFLTEALAKQAEPRFEAPVGSSLNLQFECDSPAEVDIVYEKLTDAGHKGYTAPWDAFWGQRFARVTDPDGRIVNFYAQL